LIQDKKPEILCLQEFSPSEKIDTKVTLFKGSPLDCEKYINLCENDKSIYVKQLKDKKEYMLKLFN
jgi:hypothetical protein